MALTFPLVSGCMATTTEPIDLKVATYHVGLDDGEPEPEWLPEGHPAAGPILVILDALGKVPENDWQSDPGCEIKIDEPSPCPDEGRSSYVLPKVEGGTARLLYPLSDGGISLRTHQPVSVNFAFLDRIPTEWRASMYDPGACDSHPPAQSPARVLEVNGDAEEVGYETQLRFEVTGPAQVVLAWKAKCVEPGH